MTYKQVVVVREKPVIHSQHQIVYLTKEVTIFNCCMRGYTEVTCSFEKNVFLPIEKATGEIRIDNSHCEIPVRSVTMQLKQILTQKIGKKMNTAERIISEREVPGPSPGEQDWVRWLTIELSKIKYEVALTKKKHGEKKVISSED
mmetsp:Transcript_34639/g.45553  ORF Transcript_34639/g.45553 Transcript_34639/m.45553 type:complete len:145 (-) Transcript_34639:299-733(-)